jgi:hypothetical protein
LDAVASAPPSKAFWEATMLDNWVHPKLPTVFYGAWMKRFSHLRTPNDVLATMGGCTLLDVYQFKGVGKKEHAQLIRQLGVNATRQTVLASIHQLFDVCYFAGIEYQFPYRRWIRDLLFKIDNSIYYPPGVQTLQYWWNEGIKALAMPLQPHQPPNQQQQQKKETEVQTKTLFSRVTVWQT